MTGLGHKMAIAISILGEIVTWAIVLRALVSWFPMSPNNFFIRMLDTITEPVVAPIRNLMQRLIKRPMMVDFSPLIAMIVVGNIIVPALQTFVLKLFM